MNGLTEYMKASHVKLLSDQSTTQCVTRLVSRSQKFHLSELFVREERERVLAQEIQVKFITTMCRLEFLSNFKGSGFFVKVGASWTLRGLVSTSMIKTASECDVEHYAVYTKVIEFADWIKSLVIVQ